MKPPDREKCREALEQFDKLGVLGPNNRRVAAAALRYCAELPRVVWLIEERPVSHGVTYFAYLNNRLPAVGRVIQDMDGSERYLALAYEQELLMDPTHQWWTTLEAASTAVEKALEES